VSQSRVPGGLETVVRQLVGGSDAEERDQRASTFARGLALGALVGAAIAGSTIWQRRTSRREEIGSREERKHGSEPPVAP
jgi:hypothetical protein